MITHRQLYIMARAVEFAPTLRECLKCGKIWPDWMQACGCGRKTRVLDPVKVWRQVEKGLK